MSAVASLWLSLASACAHTTISNGLGEPDERDEPGPPPALVAPEAVWVPPPGRGRLDGRSHAARIEESQRCERDGRPLLHVDPREAWAWLKECVRVGRFTELRSLLDGAWDALLRQHPEAPSLIARIVAERGGDVDGDLALLRDRRIPLFTLSQALENPELYRGRLLLVRARVTTRTMQEIELEPVVVVSAPRARPARTTPPLTRNPRRSQPPPVSFDVGTGTRLLARTTTPDPFLAPDDVVVILARFDALTSDGEDDTAQLTLLDWHRPHPGLSF